VCSSDLKQLKTENVEKREKVFEKIRRLNR